MQLYYTDAIIVEGYKQENTSCMMNINVKASKHLQMQLSNTFKRSCTMTKWVSFQGCWDGSIHANITSIHLRTKIT